MASKVTGKIIKFRDRFVINYKRDMNWYPGHMGKGMKQMQRKLKSIDLIIEVHDARIPFTGRNPNFNHQLTAIKPHLLVLNKADLSVYYEKTSDHPLMQDLMEELKRPKTRIGCPNEIILTNSMQENDQGIKSIIPTVTQMIKNSQRHHRKEVLEFGIMVIGIPNTGKSSIINRLRNVHAKLRNATRVGSVAGITQSVLHQIKISVEPLIYVFDTPGVLQPNMQNLEAGLQLALCGTYKDSLVGEDIMADYLLYWLNKEGIFRYVDRMGLDEPTDSINKLLITAAVKMDKFVKIKTVDGSGIVMRPNTLVSACEFIKDFREGFYGPVLFEKLIFKK